MAMVASLHVQAALAERFLPTKTGSWTWRFGKYSPKINFVETVSGKQACSRNLLLFLPTISDVSTTQEWQSVAKNVSESAGWSSVTVDWPGFGLSDRPALEYTAELMESFLVDFVKASDGPVRGMTPVIVGAGHAASIAAKAVAKRFLEPSGFAAVAPTWAGPLPIVFGRSPQAESRYGLLRSALRAPGLGWAMYNVLVSNAGNIKKQYESHVYAESSNVTEEMVQSRLALTKREGARYAPAAFLTGKLDPCQGREEFVNLFQQLEGQLPTLVMLSQGSPKRSKAEMEALRTVVTRFVDIPGALLPHEEFPELVAEKLLALLADLE